MAKTRSKKRNRKRTMRGGITPLEIGIGAGAAGIAALLYAYLRAPSVPTPTTSDTTSDFMDVRDSNVLNRIQSSQDDL